MLKMLLAFWMCLSKKFQPQGALMLWSLDNMGKLGCLSRQRGFFFVFNLFINEQIGKSLFHICTLEISKSLGTKSWVHPKNYNQYLLRYEILALYLSHILITVTKQINIKGLYISGTVLSTLYYLTEFSNITLYATSS